MDQSLSIVLPVFNAESTLTAQVQRLLDVLPELTPDFELLIVDDGSTDHTEEIAAELSLAYPQVRAARHARHKGIPAAVQTGLARTTGDIVFVQDERTPLSHGDLRRLWDLRADDELVMARAQPQPRPLDAGLLSRLMAWGTALKATSASTEPPGGIQMIRRRAVEELRDNNERIDRHLAVARTARTDKVMRGTGEKPAPNFIKRVRDFATGE